MTNGEYSKQEVAEYFTDIFLEILTKQDMSTVLKAVKVMDGFIAEFLGDARAQFFNGLFVTLVDLKNSGQINLTYGEVTPLVKLCKWLHEEERVDTDTLVINLESAHLRDFEQFEKGVKNFPSIVAYWLDTRKDENHAMDIVVRVCELIDLKFKLSKNPSELTEAVEAYLFIIDIIVDYPIFRETVFECYEKAINMRDDIYKIMKK